MMHILLCMFKRVTYMIMHVYSKDATLLQNVIEIQESNTLKNSSVKTGSGL